MHIDSLFGTSVQILQKNIDLRSKNQNLISSNIANAETPNYTPKALVFEQELQGALKTVKNPVKSNITNPRHINIKGADKRILSVTGRVVETPAKTPGKDGNSVELENEMTRMLENQVMYNASVQILAKKFEGIKTALREGK